MVTFRLGNIAGLLVFHDLIRKALIVTFTQVLERLKDKSSYLGVVHVEHLDQGCYDSAKVKHAVFKVDLVYLLGEVPEKPGNILESILTRLY